MNPNKHRLIFSVISHVRADSDFPVGINEWRLLCGVPFIMFVQQFESGAKIYLMVAEQTKGFLSTGLRQTAVCNHCLALSACTV